MLELLRKVKAELRHERELRKDMLRIARMPLDYEALQNMVNEVSVTGVSIEIKMDTGHVITIKPKEVTKPLTFREQYNNRRNQIG